MHSETFARSTFVIDRETADQLTDIATRLHVSRSALVRDVLAEPVALMHHWISALPEQPTPEDARGLLERIGEELPDWVESKTAQLDLLRGDGGNA